MEQGIQVEQKARVSQAVSLMVVLGVGAAAVAGFVFFGSKLSKESAITQQYAVTTTSNEVDLTTQETPKSDFVSPTASKVAESTVATPTSDVSVRITSPTEGAIVNGGTSVTVELTDPNRQAQAVRVLIFSDSFPAYMNGVSLGNKTAPPYTFGVNLAMYPSGEYTYVAQAVRFDPSIPGADTAVPIASSDTRVVWARTCYFLAYQDMTLDAPTAAVPAGTSVTLTGSLKNYHRGNCQHTYQLTTLAPVSGTSTIPTGWSATFNPAETFVMGINETKQYTMTVQIPRGTPVGQYEVGATSNRLMTGFSVNKKVMINVVAPTSGGGGGGAIRIVE